MRIKKLEILGFKSFGDRTVLNFDQPVTGVVGPNGCGKSNIVDAIRWCMGEQSAKHLRGKAMDDVIFGGCDSRGRSSMCEVSLTFENDGRVPAEFLAYSEICVSRRLHRDGTSEYLLNKTPCRLRDITDFFLGTGVGVRAYSIIEQGRVGMIVSSKPEDRRALIEEAAGITKFKIKKKAAEKKIEWTRQNLLRVSDVVTEIEKQLGSLRRQAQKAERYKQYRAEVRDIELWSASLRWLGLHAEERVTAGALVDAGERREAAQVDVSSRDAHIETARLSSAQEASRIEELQEKLYELDNRIRLGEAEADHKGREAGSLDEQAQKARGEVDLLGQQIEAAVAELARLRGEAAEAESGSAGQGDLLVESEDSARVLKEQLATGQRAVDKAKAEISGAQADIARCEGSERSLVRRLEDLEIRLSRVGEEGTRINHRRRQLDEEVAAQEEELAALRQARVDVATQLAALEKRYGETREAVARGEAELETLTTELHRRKSRHASLLEIQQRYEGFQRGTRAIMKQRDQRWGIRGLVADVVQAPIEYEVAVEAALGDRLGSIVVESPEVGVDGIEYLKTAREGRTSFVPLRARAPELDAAIDHTGPIGADVTVAAGGFAAGLVRDDGVVGDLIADDSGDALPEGVRGRMSDFVRCDDDYRGVARALLGNVVIVDDLVSAVDLWKAGARQTLVTLDGEVVDPHGVVSGGSRDAQGSGVLQQKRELRELEEIVAGLQVRHDESFNALVELRAERQRLQVAIDQARRDGHQGEMAILTHEKDLSRHREELSRINARGQSLDGDRDDLQRQRDEAQIEAEENRLKLRQARDLLIAAEDRRDQHGREMVGVMDRLEEVTARVTDLKVRTAQVAEKQRALSQAIHRAEMQRQDQEARRTRLMRTIDDGGHRSAELRQEVVEERGVLVAMAAESQTMAAELGALRAGYEGRRTSLLQAESDMKTARALFEAATADVAALELKVREARMHRDHLEQQVEDRYRVRVVDQLHDFHLRPAVGDTEEQRLRELRDLIERMGEINLTAIEEFQALETRYNFLLAQKADLETALSQLEEAIAQINRSSRKRFREVFDLVNAKFQEIYPRLFRGGRAYLTLTDPAGTSGSGGREADVLESGIEIFAQPPGKKNATVELLSGGEKALTAVSLVFAIFLIKPSPFCILDEVDAPLDEANVGRFNDLLRAMTDRSQFIVITHNKRTMEIVDTLYGITMEEPGISKLVSVNLTSSTRKVAA